MKKKTKYDFLAINRRMNQNFNGGWNAARKITKGEELKTNRKIQNGGKVKGK